MKKMSLYYHTVKYLKWKQVTARMLRKIGPKKKISLNHCDIMRMLKLYVSDLDGDEEYLQRFDIAGLMKNKVLLLHEAHDLDLNSWRIAGQTTHLWQFNLQYMEYLIPLAIKYKESGEARYYKKLREFLTTWMKRYPEPEGDAWAPYVISLRIPNLLIVINLIETELKTDREFFEELVRSLYRQYNYLQYNTEKHLLGNHYLENLKCLLICSILFGEADKENKYRIEMKRQIEEQILADGLHFERSFMYHKIVLEDLLRVILALEQAERKNDEQLSYFKETFKKMCDVEASFEKDIARTLLFNDAGNNVSKSARALIRAGKRLGLLDKVNDQMTELSEAGYYQYKKDDVQLILDCGEIGPDYIPGHGHCDCFSYELFYKGEDVIVNSGTFQYQDKKRAYFRSTGAHNTFQIGDNEQSQCWGEHRVARRIHKIRASRKEEYFIGECNYWDGSRAQREIQFEEHGFLITDREMDNTRRSLISYLHFSPNYCIKRESEVKYGIYNSKNSFHLEITIEDGRVELVQEKGSFLYSQDFGLCVPVEGIRIYSISSARVQYKVEWKE